MKRIILLSSLMIMGLYSQNNEEDLLAKQLFEKAFKKNSKHSKKQKIYLPLSVNGILQDEVLVKINSKNEIFINEETLLYILSLLKKTYQTKFTYDKNKNDFSLSILNQLGIDSAYNQKEIQLEIVIPPKIKHATRIKLNKRKKRDINGTITPSDYAGGINFYFNQQYTKSSSATESIQRQSLIGSSDIFLNIHDYVLEGRLSYIENNPEPLLRDRFRLLKDDQENALRYTIGDIFLPSQQRIGSSDSLGISVEKVLNINGLDYANNVSRISNYEFFLKNQSTVEIFINDKYTQTLRLPAGTHNLYDLKLPTGLSRIKLKIIENNGKIEFIDFNDFSYAEILEKGFVQYGMGLGIHSLREPQSNKIIYKKEEKILSAYTDYGLTNWLTIKGGVEQTNNNYQSLTLEFLLGTPLGFLDSYAIRSNANNKTGYIKGLNYRADIGVVNLNLGYEKIDQNYESLNMYNTKTIDNDIYGNLPNIISGSELYRANIYTPLPFDLNLGLIASKYRTNQNQNTEKRYGMELSKGFDNGLYARLNVNQVNNDKLSSNKQIYLTLNYTWNQTQFNYSHYQEEQKEQVEINYAPDGQYGLFSNFAYEKNQNNNRYNIRGVFNDEKFRLDTSYVMSDAKAQQNQLVGVQLATGILFAGDKTTISAPISSSFIIVDNDDKLKNPLGIEGFQNSESFIYDRYALPVGDYSQPTLNIDESELDFGIDLKTYEDKFTTKYKTGSILNINIDNYFSLKGILYDKELHTPLQYKSFRIFNTLTGKQDIGFTNEYGEFTVSGVEEGHYNASLSQEIGYDSRAKFTFDITSKDLEQQIINLNTIYIQMPKKKDITEYKILTK